MPEVLSLIGAVIAAIVAGIFALIATRATSANQRIIELEKRLATSRLETYKPMLEALAQAMSSRTQVDQWTKSNEEELAAMGRAFGTWIQMYGSDEAVRAYSHWTWAAAHDPPPAAAIRLYGQFVLAARRDLGDSASRVELIDLLGVKINDIYETGRDLRLDDRRFYRKIGWTPPWDQDAPASKTS